MANPMIKAIKLHCTIDRGNFEIKGSDPQGAAQDLSALARAGSASVRCNLIVIIEYRCDRYYVQVCKTALKTHSMPVVTLGVLILTNGLQLKPDLLFGILKNRSQK